MEPILREEAAFLDGESPRLADRGRLEDRPRVTSAEAEVES
jgi:hypothetical protein